MEVDKKHLEFIASLQNSKQEDEGVGENSNSTLSSDKLQDLEEEWNNSKSASDSGLEEDCPGDLNVFTELMIHSTPNIKNRIRKVNLKRKHNIFIFIEQTIQNILI